MTQLFYVPIEPLVERYTESWYRNFPTTFRSAGFDVTVIDGVPLEDEVKVGTFLDVNSTVHYKSTQLAQIAALFNQRRVPNGSVFFFGDVEFWGIESVRLLAQMNRLDVTLTGFLHAGSYTIEDAFAVAAPYQQYTEVGWLAACDRVYVGSDYHYHAFRERRLIPLGADDNLRSRLMVTGNPLFKSDYPPVDVSKRNKVVLPNRFDIEKRPDRSLEVARLIKNASPETEIVITTSRSTFRSNSESLVTLARQAEADGIVTIKSGLTKSEYHKELAESKVMISCSIEENFGYCIAESLVYGCTPVLTDLASHPEFPSAVLFTANDQAAAAAIRVLSTPYSEPHIPSTFWDAGNLIAADIYYLLDGIEV